MDRSGKELKKQNKINFRPILSLLIGLAFFSVILLATMFSGNPKSSGKISVNKGLADKQAEESSATANSDSEMLAVVKEIKGREQQVTLYDVNQKDTVTLSYTGGSNIIDKFGQVISAGQIPIGAMVDVEYLKETGKLTKMQVSTKTWEYIGVKNMSIDRSNRVIKIGFTKYKYTDDIIILDEGEFIPVVNLAEQDELTVRGDDETIWSITVTRGHGTVKLEDYEAFLGANITIGYEAMQQVAEDMSITVREGNFNLTVENGMYSATKNITVLRNRETIVSLSDLGPEAEKMSRVNFTITPFGADLIIDGELTSYANPIELTYGEHAIEVSLGEYTTYQGTLNIQEAGKMIKIYLPEATSDEEASISVTEDGTDNTAADGSGAGDTAAGSETTGDAGTVDGIGNQDNTVDELHFTYVQNPIGASIYLNGEYMGISPGSFKKIIGTHVLTFIMEGYETKSYTVEVVDDGLDTYFSLPDLVKTE